MHDDVYQAAVATIKENLEDALKALSKLPLALDPQSDFAKRGWSSRDNALLAELGEAIALQMFGFEQLQAAIGPPPDAKPAKPTAENGAHS